MYLINLTELHTSTLMCALKVFMSRGLCGTTHREVLRTFVVHNTWIVWLEVTTRSMDEVVGDNVEECLVNNRVWQFSTDDLVYLV